MLNGHVVEKPIAHGESRYDPVKAHEYYERTKQLKGRGRRGKLSDEQKAGIAYTKHVVGEDKKQTLERAAQEHKASVEQLRKKAQERREEIRQKLQEIMEKLSDEATVTREKISDEAKANREKINDDVKAKIDALPDIPDGLSKARRAELSAKRQEEIAKIRGEAEGEKEKINNEATGKRKDVNVYVKAKKKGERDISNAVREQVGAELKQSFEKAKKAYDSAKEEIRSRYEAEARREAEAVVANVK